MKEFIDGFYSIRVYLPLSGLSRKWRRFSRKLRGKTGGLLQQISLPGISWQQCTASRLAKIWEQKKTNGNIRVSELGIINLIANDVEADTILFEIGTFDGRTTLNLAFSAPQSCQVLSLDLTPEMETEYTLVPGETHMVEKESSGARIEKYRQLGHPKINKIQQLFGDSARFDFSPYYDACSLVFIDGSHAYDYALSDTREAMRMLKKGGVILWHDYGIWEGVTKALEEIENTDSLGLKNINGTSLVYWRKT